MAKYNKALVAVGGLLVYVLAAALGVEMGEVPGLEVNVEVVSLLVVEAFLVYLVPNRGDTSDVSDG